MEDRVEPRAMALVESYYQSRGWKVQNVSKARGDHGGYDFLATRDGELLRVEVKGCTKPFGIPDPYYSEFHPETRQLIADVLYVVYFLPGAETPQLTIIKRADIPPEYVTPKYAYRISSKFKNARSISRFIVPL